MALWSLTQERVEKLRKQMGDKETEVDRLIKLSKEDLWRIDLDEFIDVWRSQLEEEKHRGKANASRGRRVSMKLKTEGGRGAAKKRKALDDDSDFDAPKSKKSVTAKHIKPKGGLLDYLSKPSKPKAKTYVDGASDSDEFEPEVIPEKRSRTTAKPKASPTETNESSAEPVIAPKKRQGSVQPQAPKPTTLSLGDFDSDLEMQDALSQPEIATTPETVKPSPVDEDSDIEVIPKPTTQRQARTNRKPIKYQAFSSSESDNGDDLLGDVSNMVKGLRDNNVDPHSESRTLFSEPSRPGPSSASKPTTKAQRLAMAFDPDETDYSKLIPQNSPRRSLLVKPKETKASSEVEDESRDVGTTTSKAGAKGKAATVKPAAASKSTAKAAAPKSTKATSSTTTKGRPKKTAAAPATSKPTQLSPAAKAYASKKAKATKKLMDDDSDDDIDAMANDILDSGPEDSPAPAPARGRPARRAVTTKKQPTYVIDDDSDELASDGEENESSDGFSESD